MPQGLIIRRVLMVAVVSLLGAVGVANADQNEMLPVPSVTIYPGDPIAETMLVDRPFPAGTSATFPVVIAHTELMGKIARRTLLPGKPIAVNSVAVRALVQRGTIVPATYRDGALVITASVLALQDGALNAAIQARNVDSGKIIVGAVQADGSIQIGSQ